MSQALADTTLVEQEATLTDASGTRSEHRGPRLREPGEHIDRYIVLAQLGKGGMGVVYAAYDPKLDRKIALKVLHADLGGAGYRARLMSEARALARVTHPKVVAVHDVITEGAEVCIDMELVSGCNLQEHLAEQARPWLEILTLFLDFAEGVAAIHAAGLVHRDIKPANVLVDEGGRVRVTDFGLARAGSGSASSSLAEAELELVDDALADTRATLTRTGALVGTPAYMAPEQFEGGEVTARSDQFSFCVALWEALYGQRPFPATSLAELITAVTSGELREPPPPPAGVGPVPRWLREIVARGLRAEPEARWASMDELREALAAGDPSRVQRRRWMIFAGVAGLCAALALGSALQARARDRARAAALASCEARSALEGWGEAQAGDIRARFVASGVPEAEQVASAVIEELDAFAAAWPAAKRELCVAAEIEHSLDPVLPERRGQCLDEQRGAFETFVEVFAEADAATVSRAQEAVGALSVLDHCSDDRALMHQPPAPEDPQVRARVAELGRELYRTRVDEHVGRYARGLAQAEAVLAEAEGLDHAPLVANAQFQIASFHKQLGAYEPAVEAWRAAFEQAVLVGHDQLAANAAMALAHVEGESLRRRVVGLRWAELAGVYLRRVGELDPLIEAKRLEIMAIMLDLGGEHRKAIAMHERSLAYKRETGGPHHHSVGFGLVNLAAAHAELDEDARALELMLEAREIFSAHYGADSPRMGDVHKIVAHYQFELERDEQALASIDAAMEIWTRTLEPDHPSLARGEQVRGMIYKAQDQLEPAIVAFRRSCEIASTSLAGNPNLSGFCVDLGQMLLRRGQMEDLPEAEAAFEAILDVLPPEDLDEADRRGRAQHGLASIALARGQLERAQGLFERALAEFSAQRDPLQTWLARCELGLGELALMRAEGEQARVRLERVLGNEEAKSSTQARARALSSGQAVPALGSPGFY